MQHTVYEDYKYTMQDAGNLYIGAKYTLGEILGNEDITFKFRMVLKRNLLPEASEEDSLETHLYYLDDTGFNLQIYKQLKARVKVNLIVEKKSLLGKRTKEYTTRMLKIEELAAMPVSEKEAKGVVVQELAISKLALMAF